MFTTRLVTHNNKLEYTLLVRVMLLAVALANGKYTDDTKQWEYILAELRNVEKWKEPAEEIKVSPSYILIVSPKCSLIISGPVLNTT